MQHGGFGDDHNGCDGVLLNQLMDLRCSCLLRGPLAKRTRLPVMEHLLFASSRTAPGQLLDSSRTAPGQLPDSCDAPSLCTCGAGSFSRLCKSKTRHREIDSSGLAMSIAPIACFFRDAHHSHPSQLPDSSRTAPGKLPDSIERPCSPDGLRLADRRAWPASQHRSLKRHRSPLPYFSNRPSQPRRASQPRRSTSDTAIAHRSRTIVCPAKPRNPKTCL